MRKIPISPKDIQVGDFVKQKHWPPPDVFYEVKKVTDEDIHLLFLGADVPYTKNNYSLEWEKRIDDKVTPNQNIDYFNITKGIVGR